MHKRQFSDNILQKTAFRTCMNCGCTCNGQYVTDPSHSLDLQQQIEELHSQLLRSHANLSNMEQDYGNKVRALNTEIMKLREELIKLRDRYERLLESHKRLQKVNDSLENKLLNVVNITESEKTRLQKDVASMTSRLVEAKSVICDLEEENERYRSDCNLAVQMLQCNPSNFVGQKLSTLPLSLQERVKSHMTSEQILSLENEKSETNNYFSIPMQTFPPTAMVYSVPKQSDVTALSRGHPEQPNELTVLLAQVLTQPGLKRTPQRTYICLKCREDYTWSNKETQTSVLKEGERCTMETVRVHRLARHLSTPSDTEYVQ